MDQLQVRKAEPADAAAIARLLSQLGHSLPDDESAARLRWFSRSGADHLLVAVGGVEAVGLLALTVIPRITHDGPFGRITFLGVPEGEEQAWIQRALLGEGERLCRRHQCTAMEVMATSPPDDEDDAFGSLGYHTDTNHRLRCVKALDPPKTVRI
ncbi:MAG: hypothetical protein R6V28_03700 [Nitriliruptoraceae bacterium]